MVVKKKKSASNKKAPVKKKKVVKKKKAGGKRKGAGRPKGSTVKGRPPGACTNAAKKLLKKTREVADKLLEEGGQTPLEFLLAVMWETADELKAKFEAKKINQEEYLVGLAGLQKRRYEAAKDAAPYMHPKLASIEQTKGGEHENWLDKMEREAGL